ncbi:protein ROOT HAIR DEFECTIVE 3 homolog 2-like isoform X2 [Miscanthus floridulus]|uniref:protein ROOT HAIR DEFECTIVE 3 homolog 2-like isoform X2 n=1 Tax=Miscanthus floridulus TaxID=154761 RepID=UPI0034579325
MDAPGGVVGVGGRGGECHAAQVVGADGEMDAAAMERFAAAEGLRGRGLSYAVVSILGPQGSGKSTLLNHLFGTSFREMDALKGRHQTTKGIWIAKAVGIEPFTVVLDLEGMDGRERGQDDTAFEKQSALFALAVSDIVMINLWCHDIGREHAANRPLLRTVFQTPLEYLTQALKEDIQKIWDSVQKPEAYKEAALSDFFNVEVTALSSYEEKEELFKEQVGQLRQRFYHSTALGGLAADRRGVVPASGFCLSALQIWKVIRENKDLNLPAHKVMVATVRCEEIANEKLKNFLSDKGWLELDAAVKSGLPPSFGTKLSAILDSYLSEYDMETMYFDEGVRAAKRQQLQSSMLDHTYPAIERVMEHLHLVALNKFKSDLEQSLRNTEGFAESVRQCSQASVEEFDAGIRDTAVKHVQWDASKARNKLQEHIQAHVESIRNAKLAELKANYEKLSDAIAGPVQSILETGERDSWACIRRLYRRETENAALAFSASLSEFELDQTICSKMVSDLREHARSVVEMKAREEAGNVLMRMKERFFTVLSHDRDLMPRTWMGDEDIRSITREARLGALRLMSVMAAIRLDDKPNKIERALTTALLDGGPLSHKRSIEFASDPLASSTWEEVSPKDTLITPVQCKSIWRQFKAETEYSVAQAMSMQEAHRRSKSWLPPAWTILLLAILGYNEFMFLLRNPLYLLGLFVAFVLSYAIWLQYDITAYFRHGTLSTTLTILSRLLPTIMDIVMQIINMSHRHKHSPHPSRRPQPIHAQSFMNQTWGQPQVQYKFPDSPSSSSSSVDSNSGDDS